jgi:hypothetical protein
MLVLALIPFEVSYLTNYVLICHVLALLISLVVSQNTICLPWKKKYLKCFSLTMSEPQCFKNISDKSVVVFAKSHALFNSAHHGSHLLSQGYRFNVPLNFEKRK